jgi:tetratricopeptide (TPR) repeat protein
MYYCDLVISSGQRELLIQRFRAVRLRRVGVALALSGPPGIGKTHLAETVLLHLNCRSLRVHATVSMRSFILALPSSPRRPAWVEPVFGQVTHGGAVAPVRMLDALAAHLQAAAPFVLHVEDLHEATSEQQAFWRALAHAVTQLKGVGLLVTSRETALGVETLPVTELEQDEAAELLQSEVSAPLPAPALAWIYGWARGNPLFTREYFRLLTRLGHLWSDGQVWRWRSPEGRTHPPTVEALISERLSGLRDESALRLLDALTLLPLEAGLNDAAGVAQLGQQTAQLAWDLLMLAGILNHSGFAQPLYREIHGATMPPDRQRTVARSALAYLVPRPEWAALFVELAVVPDAEAARLLRAAADSARRRGHTDQEAQFLWNAAERLHGSRRAALAQRAARVVGPLDQARASTYARAAYAEVPTRSCTYTLALCLARSGDTGEASRLLRDQGAGEARSEDQARWWQVCLEVEVIGGNDRQAIQIWTQMLRLGYRGNAHTHGLVASAFLNLGDLTQARQMAEAGLAFPDPSFRKRARLLNVLAGVSYFRGEFDQAQTWQDAAIADCHGSGHPAEAAGILGNRALVRAARGQTRQAAEDLEAAMNLHASVGQGRQYAFQQQRLGALLARMGEWERAEEQLLEARAVLARTDMLGWQAECEGELAKLYLEWKPLWGAPRALRHARTAVDTARRFQNPAYQIDALFVCGWAEAQYGSAEAALALAAELSLLAPPEASVGRGYAHWVEGLARQASGQVAEACAALTASMDTFQAAGIEVLRQRVQLEYGRLTQAPELIGQSVRYFQDRGLHGRVGAGSRELPTPALAARARIPGYELKLLGPLEVWSQGVKCPLRGRQSHLLLATLGEAAILGGGEVAHLSLTDELYSGLPEKQALTALQQLIHRLRALTGPDFVQRGPQGYALGPGVKVDAVDFLSTGDVSLWRGTYLGSEQDSTAARQLYDALKSVAWPSGQGQSDGRAVFLAELLLRADPFDRETLRHTLRTLKRARAYRKLDRIYRESVRLFMELGEALPERWQHFLET